MEWRLILDASHTGAWNMGVDEALLISAAQDGVPALRLYEWDRPWLSLGYRQSYSESRREACEREGIGIVRRATGGQAVLHGADLTYAVAAPARLISADLGESYRRISFVLVAALQSLGIPAAAMPARGASEPLARDHSGLDFDCFQQPAPHEICLGPAKLAGSAQRRFQGALLQHGSIRVGPDSAAHRVLAGLAGDAATSLSESGYEGAIPDLAQACVDAFQREFETRWRPDSLAPEERKFAAEREAQHALQPLESPRFPQRDASRELLSGR